MLADDCNVGSGAIYGSAWFVAGVEVMIGVGTNPDPGVSAREGQR